MFSLSGIAGARLRSVSRGQGPSTCPRRSLGCPCSESLGKPGGERPASARWSDQERRPGLPGAWLSECTFRGCGEGRQRGSGSSVRQDSGRGATCRDSGCPGPVSRPSAPDRHERHDQQGSLDRPRGSDRILASLMDKWAGQGATLGTQGDAESAGGATSVG